MRGLLLYITITLVLFVATKAAAQETIELEDGRSVVLNEDRTWRFADEEKQGDGPPPSLNGEKQRLQGDDPEQTAESGLRKTTWGMSRKQVIEAEGRQPDGEEDGIIGYKTEIVGLDAMLIYFFADEKLVRGTYSLTKKYVNKNNYIDQYKKLRAALLNKYGKPKNDGKIWKNNLYRDDRDNWGLAIGMGHLQYLTQWQAPGMEVSIYLTGENFEVNMHIQYLSTRLRDLEDQVQQAEANEAL